MEKWMMYVLLAAISISLRDVFSTDIINKYEYIDYIIFANIIVFIGTMIFVFTAKKKIIVPGKKDLIVILLRLLIVYLIIEPCIFNSMKYCKNPGYAKSIINLNTLFVFVLAIFFLKADFDKQKILGAILITGGAYFLE